MRFSLQDMVRQTLAEAEDREKVAQLQPGSEPDESKKKDEDGKREEGRTTTKETGNTPDRNYEGITEKTSSAFVEKLASAVEYLNDNYLEKDAVGEAEPPLSHGTMHTTVGPGIGATALETNVDAPVKGMQSTETGQAKHDQPPMDPGTDPKAPGQTNPQTALETDLTTPPGGKEDWTDKDVMKQAASPASLANRLRNFAGGRKAAIGEAASHLKGAIGKGSTLKERAIQVGRAAKASPELATAAVLGTAGAAKGVHGLATRKKTAQMNRVAGIITKMAEGDGEGASIQAAHHDNPPPATQAEQGVPSLPGPAAKQERLINSNQAAIDYTKREAKAVPKEQMGEVIDEPAQKKSTDPVLQNNLGATDTAGVKISSAEEVKVARALLQKIAEEGAKEDASPEEKERASKLQEVLKAKQEEQKQEKAAGFGRGSMPISGGY